MTTGHPVRLRDDVLDAVAAHAVGVLARRRLQRVHCPADFQILICK